MAILNAKCDCGKIVSTNVGDAIHNSKLYWFQSYLCDNCGRTIEMDSDEAMPIDVKKAIILEQGCYGLFLNNIKERTKVKFILKKISDSNLPSVKEFLDKETDEIVQGTQNEVLIFKEYLELKGIKNCIIKRLNYNLEEVREL